MGYPRISLVKDRSPGFSIELPPGLMIADLADAGPLAPVFTGAERFAVILSPNGPAVIELSVIAAAGQVSLSEILRCCAADRGLNNPLLARENFGGTNHRHPGLICEIASGRTLAAFEDAGVILVMEARADLDIWADYQPFLTRAMLSIELLAPEGPTLPLATGEPAPPLAPGLPDADDVESARRDAAMRDAAVEAERLIGLQRFADAEALVMAVDQGSVGCAQLGQIYERRLRAGDGDETARETLFRRALAWKLRAWPEPHTQIEAERFARGAAEDRTRLIELLGRDPTSDDS